jgi:uncharacterized protein YdhG (YjbR/CyaY superfamily)
MVKRIIVPGGIDEYIEKCPKEVRSTLEEIRKAIRKVAPDATETVSYFQFPGYHYDGDYPYNGMFAWFSYKEPYIRLHIWPEVIKRHKKELSDYKLATGAISFTKDQEFSMKLVEQLVSESLQYMKEKAISAK